MDKETFIATVLSHLPAPSAEDLESCYAGINNLFLKGFTVEDAVTLCKHLVEHGCELPEEEALAVIDSLHAKYRKV